MPRYSRNSIKSIFFHVMIQGVNKEDILKNDNEKKYFIYIINMLKKICKVKVIAYCIMDNHVHLLIKADNIDELIKFMHRLNTKYAIYYNKKYNRVGHVFRDRYRSEGIFSEEQFYNCINYIYNNPVKAGICERVSDYKFSNYFENKKYIVDNFQCVEEFIDVKEKESDEEIINKYLQRENININNIKRNKKLLKVMIRYFRDKKVSYRSIEKIIGISREKLRKINNAFE